MKGFMKVLSAVVAASAVVPLFACNPAVTETEEITAGEQTQARTETQKETETEPTVTEPVYTFTITEEGGKASVVSGDLSYTANGYESVSGEKFRIKDKFKAEIDGFNQKFNRLSFTYSSGEPLKLYVTYTLNSSEKTDTFFVEAAEEGVFSCLISSYLNAGVADKLLSVSAETCRGVTTDFVIYGVTAEEISLINKNTYYIENDRFKVGINLAWGGGINYVQDKTKKVKGVTNLVNSHDTGRLIQQSYYGTAGNGEYQPEVSMGHKWVYNPVQGGDQHGNASRLIDLSFTKTSVYIKAQPQDWSHNNYLTPSYMENTYTVTDEYIKVDNRFVDFSGWEHPFTGQELPALYTISYLSRFTWYDGTEPWTDGGLSYSDSLNFWGDAQYVAECTKKLKTSNSETWCAWTNPGDDFGLGIYVPNVDLFKAGRYKFDNSKKASDDSTNYVAPYNTMKMISYKPIEYSYLMTTGSIEQIRAAFKKNKDFTDNASLHNDYISSRIYGGETDPVNAEFETEDSVLLLSLPNNTQVSYSAEYKAAKLTSVGADPHVEIDYTGGTYSADELKTLTIEYMIPKDNSQKTYCTDLFICSGSTTAPDGGKRVRKDLTADGEFHTLTVSFANLKYWSGKINLIRFDYFDNCGNGDVMYLCSFKLS